MACQVVTTRFDARLANLIRNSERLAVTPHRHLDEVPGERPRLLRRLQEEFERGEAS